MPDHRVVEDWMGSPVETLEDLLKPGLTAVCVGINPAPTSVAAEHYYQGKLGQAFFARLRRAGVLPAKPGWEDDVAFENGIGFTDIVKRPTASAKDLRPDEYRFGQSGLIAKLEAVGPRLIVFTFKKTATVLLGPIIGSGFVGREISGVEVYVMPGPYAPRDEVDRKLAALSARFR